MLKEQRGTWGMSVEPVARRLCFGSLADIAAVGPNVRFISENGHRLEPLACTLSAKPGSRKLKQNHWNALDIAKRASARLNCVQLPAEERQCGLGDNTGVVDEWPVSAVRQNLYLSSGEDLALTLGEFNGDVGILCAPDHQCRQVQGAQRFGELTRFLFRIEGISIKP